ncbi:MAG: hypothetical protein U0353_25335 [Sandaracinus sp.]
MRALVAALSVAIGGCVAEAPVEGGCGEPLISGVSQCSPCEPWCFRISDWPICDPDGACDLCDRERHDAQLAAGEEAPCVINADALEYDPIQGGARLAETAPGQYASSGRYLRSVDSSLGCDLVSETPSWNISWSLDLPPGTHAELDVRLATSWGMEPWTRFAIPAEGALPSPELRWPGELVPRIGNPYLDLVFWLYPSPDHASSPTLRHVEVEFYCSAQ